MKTIYSTDELLALLDENGKLTEPVMLADDCGLRGLSSIKSLAGLTLGNWCWLYDLHNLTSLAGLRMGVGCRLHDLTNLTSLNNVEL